MICLRIEFLCLSTHYKWARFHNFERPRTREGNIAITLNHLGGICRSSSPSANSTYFHIMLSLTGSTFTGPNLHVKNSSELYVIFYKEVYCYMVSRGREPTHLVFTLLIGVFICNFEKWKKQLRKGLFFCRRKGRKRRFLSSNVQSLHVLSTKMSGLLMFCK